MVNVLHPSVNSVISSILFDIYKRGDKRISFFDEIDASKKILIENVPLVNQTIIDEWVEDVVNVLVSLDASKKHKSLPSDLIQQIKVKGSLPASNGSVANWSKVRQSARSVPTIPGIVEPSILHPRLMKLKILKEGPLKIPKFNLNDFVSNVNFNEAGDISRQRFFEWLRKGYKELSPKALSNIAEYPVWLGVDKEYRILEDYCWPQSQNLRKLIHAVHVAPAEAVINFRGLRKSHNGAIRLRTEPSEQELRDWYLSRAQAVRRSIEEGHIDDALKSSSELEKALDQLRQQKKHRVEVIAEGHFTFTKRNFYKTISELHCPTLSVKQCNLDESDMVEGQYHKLYETLGAHQRPTKSALVRALILNVDPAFLYNRLEEYKSLGMDLSELSNEPIILVKGKPMPPGSLTLPGTINWWGDWKTPIDSFPDVPERVALLERVGVVRPALRDELSRSFFQWLSSQPQPKKKQHLQQIVRHWGERRHGPLKWMDSYPYIDCIPVYGKTIDFELINFRRVTSGRSSVFLPDFRDIQDKLLAYNRSVRLVITSTDGVRDSVLDVMRDAGIPSLRFAAGRPIRILTSEDIERDEQSNQWLKKAQSKETVAALTQKLPEYDVPVNALRRDWRGRLASIQGIRIAGSLTAIYSVLNREYDVFSDSGIDEPTNLLCIDCKADRKLSFYEALAGHLFTADSNPLLAYGLLRAIESRHQPTRFNIEAGLDEYEENEGQGSGLGNVNQEPVVSKKGHGFTPDKLIPTVPAPGLLSDISDETKLSGKKHYARTASRGKSSTDDRRNSVEEEEQKLELKEKHYAWHCQACLGQYEAIDAAPLHSYVYTQSIRRKLIEAHHVDHLQNKGALGAKNLVVLCTFHHEYFGDRLSSSTIIESLTQAKSTTRKFYSNHEGTSYVKLKGIVAEIMMDGSDGKALLFFTEQHANAWKNVKN